MGQRDWTRGTYLANAEQETEIIEWLSRWSLMLGTTRVVADHAVFNVTGSDRGSTAATSRLLGVLDAGWEDEPMEANDLPWWTMAGQHDAETPWRCGPRFFMVMAMADDAQVSARRGIVAMDAPTTQWMRSVMGQVLGEVGVGTKHAAHPMLWMDCCDGLGY